MSEIIRKRSEKSGFPPGTLIHIGDKKVEKTTITILDYNEEKSEKIITSFVDKCSEYKQKPTITWISVDGISDIEVIEKLGNYFGLHPLLLEDIITTDQFPKMEDYDDYIFIVLKIITYENIKHKIESEQISLILGNNFVLSFQEQKGDIFNPIRDRIENNKGRIRKLGADYLVYALIDAIVDNYFIALEKLNERIEDLEEELVVNPSIETLHSIYHLRREMIFLRKSSWHLREVLSKFSRSESPVISKSTDIYLRDVHDHTIQIIDIVETIQETLVEMLDVYLSSVSNRLNEVMKVLTIIATIFIPLTFITSLYGMNFKFMPELYWRWGYPCIVGLMFVIGFAMLYFFKKKKWF